MLDLAGMFSKALPRLAKGLYGLANAVSKGQPPKLQKIRCDATESLDKYPAGKALIRNKIDFGYELCSLVWATILEMDVLPPLSPGNWMPMLLPSSAHNCSSLMA